MSNKKMSVANFNVVFFDNEGQKPLLEYFDTIVYPAFSSGIKKESGDSKYLIMDTNIRVDKDGEYVFVGKIVKKTTLEIKSDIDESGKLIEKDDTYSTAPYSMFLIYLRNHRMLYIENQKGSPSLKSFTSTAKYILNEYVRRLNKKAKEEGVPESPIPILSIIGIPRREDIESILKSVKSINSLTLRFLPLNGDGDIDFGGMFNTMSRELRRETDAPKGEVILRSPKNVTGIANVLEDAQGTVEPIFKVTYPDKTKGTINNDLISESMQISIVGDNIENNIPSIIAMGKEMKNISYVSEANNEIYEKNKNKIITLFPK